jgi:ribonuclease-3
VSSAALARLGEKIDIGHYLILGRGEEKTGGRQKSALIADSYEALIAAIYLDGGIDAVRGFIERQFGALIQEAKRTGAHVAFTEDYKSALQEWLQSHDRGLPAYRMVAETGPAHRRMFEVEVLVEGEPIARAEGKSKKEAAQAGAKLALERLAAPAE